MSSHDPYYRRVRPSQKIKAQFKGDHSRVDFSNAHLAAFDEVDPVAKATAQFDDRVAAVLRAYARLDDPASFWPGMDLLNLIAADLLDYTPYYDHDASPVLSPGTRCLAILAYSDFFGAEPVAKSVVSEAILLANPGWCGTFGPSVDSGTDILEGVSEGNYDITQMHLLPMAYRYYDELTPQAREHLITVLLAGGTIHGPGQDDTHTCGPFPEVWGRAGMVSPLGIRRSIGETENHILMIMTARYLTNQLLYQREPSVIFDNRRNSPLEIVAAAVGDKLAAMGINTYVAPHKEPSAESCTALLLGLLRRILRDDFSEYNAKGYQLETRWALLNLCTYAYDHEVRLAARMVLDYLSALFAVSTNDLRRIVPFRRRNESPKNDHDSQGFMTTAILDWQDGADPMGPTFAILAGNIRAYEQQHPAEPDPNKQWAWGIRADRDGGDQVVDALSDYRLPPSIHDLFVNDRHRRFHQRLHRFIYSDHDEHWGNRNCDNMEIYAGSPSYLITAGGAPATYAIDPYFLGAPRGPYVEQRGVAVTTTFMPTTFIHKSVKAAELIQFSCFTDVANGILSPYGAWNYGVAPDFACGHQIHLPDWLQRDLLGTPRYVADGHLTFIDQGPVAFARAGYDRRPGFFLAIFVQNDFALLEAFDTWLHPRALTFEQFQQDVKYRNRTLSLQNNVVTHYKTWNGTEFDFVIWNDGSRHDASVGAEVMNVVYGERDPRDSFGNAGNVTDQFLNGTVLNSAADAVMEITNHDLGTKITLDMSDVFHPRRIAETGKIEQAGFGNEVYLDFDWKGPNQGDACQPFSTMAGAIGAVAEGGVIKILPGQTRDRTTIGGGKRMTLVAPIGGVRIGVR